MSKFDTEINVIFRLISHLNFENSIDDVWVEKGKKGEYIVIKGELGNEFNLYLEDKDVPEGKRIFSSRWVLEKVTHYPGTRLDPPFTYVGKVLTGSFVRAIENVFDFFFKFSMDNFFEQIEKE